LGNCFTPTTSHGIAREHGYVGMKTFTSSSTFKFQSSPTADGPEPQYSFFFVEQARRENSVGGNRIEDQIGPRVLSSTCRSRADRLCQPASRLPPPSLNSPTSLCWCNHDRPIQSLSSYHRRNNNQTPPQTHSFLASSETLGHCPKFLPNATILRAWMYLPVFLIILPALTVI
jgi:hypothetical protein